MNIKILGTTMAILVVTSACTGAHNEHSDQADDAHMMPVVAYTPNYELYGQMAPLEPGAISTLLLHLTSLDNFRAADSVEVSASLKGADGTPVAVEVENVHAGLHRLTLRPDFSGQGTLRVIVAGAAGADTANVALESFATHDQAHQAIEEASQHASNTVYYPKETSWLANFATDTVGSRPMGIILRAMGLVETSISDMRTVTARTSGTVLLGNGDIVAGHPVSAGQTLMRIDASGQADNNLSVTLSQARAECEAARRDYERKSLLAEEQIVSQADLQESLRRYQESNARYEQLQRSFPGGAQIVTAPIAGTIAQVFVANGQYVETGAPLVSISRGQDYTITALLPASEAGRARRFKEAIVQLPRTGQSFTLEELGGSLTACGTMAAQGTSLVPLTLNVRRNEALVPGTYVELYLNLSDDDNESVVVPSEALVEEMGNYFVYVQLTPELFEKRAVRTGQTDSRNTEILSGLSAGERIVTAGAPLLKVAQSAGKVDAHAGHVH